LKSQIAALRAALSQHVGAPLGDEIATWLAARDR